MLRNRPSLPFSLWDRVFSGLPDLCLAGGTPEISLSKYVVTWYCRRSQRSSTMSWGAPAAMFSCSLWFILTMSTSLWVRSSSDRSPDSRVMEGLTVTGGTGRTVRTVHSGRATAGSISMRSTSSSGIISSLSRMSIGVRRWPSW